jgi:Protein of unknown function (DUF1580)
MNDKPHLLHEKLVTLKGVARRLPSSRPGRSVHIHTVRRWTLKGINGVVLGTVTVGGTIYTSEQEIERWGQAVQRKRAAVRECHEKVLRQFRPRAERLRRLREWLNAGDNDQKGR